MVRAVLEHCEKREISKRLSVPSELRESMFGFMKARQLRRLHWVKCLVGGVWALAVVSV